MYHINAMNVHRASYCFSRPKMNNAYTDHLICITPRCTQQRQPQVQILLLYLSVIGLMGWISNRKQTEVSPITQ